MTRHPSLVRRALVSAAAAAALYLESTAAIALASAHVHASSDDAVRGGIAVVTFEVPNESTKGAATTALTVNLPDLTSVQAETKPGWTTKLDRDSASGTVRSVTWTAAPNGGIGVDQFGLFRISVKLPDADTVSFPTTQAYADGSVVKWDQLPQPGGAEPSNPAPVLTLADGPTPPPTQHAHPSSAAAPTGAPASTSQKPRATADNTARVLSGAALLLAALGIGVALVARRT
ncbi:YcnI family copper-binding membrane protein [Candidatus Mycobacterium methanotrophicum]|uniref:YcnI family protein n=1 Tax=Candidatus Mycobacterium methanotrophicum TaxID=2943498 RepID=A0ABY4QMA0_9MYCO|nr:YcnI family protein [Candidatus Mycobacterium methanotrophicum]UQX11085.1 YcnI family protein [Candidatus Mycobacterium methanotrophicum]